MARDIFPRSYRRSHSARRRESSSLQLEALEDRRVFSTSQWLPIADLAPPIESASGVPIADPAVLVATGNPNTDAASLLAAGGPGNPTLPGFANVTRVGNNGTAVYLGAGWVITANHVGLTSAIDFGGTWYTIDMSSVRQLKNADNTLTDLKMFRVEGEPPLPEILSSYIATAPASGHVFMIGNGLTRDQELFWSVSRAQSPWVWTQISEPLNPGTNNFAGVSFGGSQTIRWGDNMVAESGMYNDGLNVTGFLTQFDKLRYTGQNALANEAQASPGDSGGAVFSQVGGKWVLSGLMLAVSGPLGGQPGNTAIYGNITLSIDLSAYRTQILNIVGVADRNVFYNQSSFDGNNAGINSADDAAIATDKSAYLPGSGLATSANTTSYARGINGIMVDLASTHGTITAADFSFKVGNNNSPNTWAIAPAPTAISVRPGAGVGGTDRIEITWANNVIANQWLEVIVKGNDATGAFNTNTGLAASDVFLWGNKIADAGSLAGVGTFNTTTTDSLQVFASLGSNKPITDPQDYNRDGFVNTTDSLLAIANFGMIVRIDISAAGPFAPEAQPNMAVNDVDDRDAAIAFALSAPLTAGVALTSDKLAAQWESLRAIAQVFSQWAESQPSRWGPRSAGMQEVAGRLELDNASLDRASLDWSAGDADDASDLAWLAELSHRLLR